MSNTNTTNYLSSNEIARRYGIGTDLLRQWRRYQSFPQGAVERRGATAYWDANRVDTWLRSREVRGVGRPARWLEVVGHEREQSRRERTAGERGGRAQGEGGARKASAGRHVTCAPRSRAL